MILQKIEDTWYEVLRYYHTKFDTTPRVFKGWWLGLYLV